MHANATPILSAATEVVNGIIPTLLRDIDKLMELASRQADSTSNVFTDPHSKSLPSMHVGPDARLHVFPPTLNESESKSQPLSPRRCSFTLVGTPDKVADNEAVLPRSQFEEPWQKVTGGVYEPPTSYETVTLSVVTAQSAEVLV
jgi:hypothetical protein